MRNWMWMLCLVLAACSTDTVYDSTYPAVVSEMVVADANDAGMLATITTDAGVCYAVTNPQGGYRPRSSYRAMASFYAVALNAVTLRELSPAWVLRDSTSTLRHDPTGVVAVWRGGRFINLHLAPKTRDARRQGWGFALDSVVGRTHHVSLHHNQNGDPEAYSTTVYASLPIDSIKAASDGDTIAIAVHTPTQVRRWKFAY